MGGEGRAATNLSHSLEESTSDGLFMRKGDFGNEQCYIGIPCGEHSSDSLTAAMRYVHPAAKTKSAPY